MTEVSDYLERAATTSRVEVGRARLPILVFVAVLVALVIGVLGRQPGGHPLGSLVHSGDAAGFNVLLVSLDTTRQDRIGCYGYEPAETPVIDSLAARGVRFDDAVATTPLTLPSHATLLTGLYPPNHGARDNGLYHLSEDHVTLAERLKDQGYDTAAFVACFVLDERFGLRQGFDTYNFEVTEQGHRQEMPDFNERPAGAVTDAAIGWLRAQQGAESPAPFFMWVHYFDPHLPYRSPLQYHPSFADRPYDAEIAWVDRQLGRLLEEFERLQLMENTLIVLVADHGESLGEHDEPTHGMFIYEAAVRVPFIISSARLFDGAHVEDGRVVGLVDVRPTIEDLLGLAPADDGDGRSLLRSRQSPDRAIYLETLFPRNQWGCSPLFGLRTHQAKYIQAPASEYYDLTADAAETQNLFGDDAPGLAALQAGLTALMDTWEMDDRGLRQISDEEIERLSSLGYIQGSTEHDESALPDPKEMMSLVNRSSQVEELYAAGRIEEAANLAREVVAECPSCTPAVRVLAFSLLRLGQADEAIRILRASVARRRDTYLIRSLAQALILSGRYADVEEVLALYERTDPRDGRIHLLRGDVHDREGHPRAALAEYRKAMALDGNRVGLTAQQRIARVEQELELH